MPTMKFDVKLIGHCQCYSNHDIFRSSKCQTFYVWDGIPYCWQLQTFTKEEAHISDLSIMIRSFNFFNGCQIYKHYRNLWSSPLYHYQWCILQANISLEPLVMIHSCWKPYNYDIICEIYRGGAVSCMTSFCIHFAICIHCSSLSYKLNIQVCYLHLTHKQSCLKLWQRQICDMWESWTLIRHFHPKTEK